MIPNKRQLIQLVVVGPAFASALDPVCHICRCPAEDGCIMTNPNEFVTIPSNLQETIGGLTSITCEQFRLSGLAHLIPPALCGLTKDQAFIDNCGCTGPSVERPTIMPNSTVSPSQAPAPPSGHPMCHICGCPPEDGCMITNPTALVDIPTILQIDVGNLTELSCSQFGIAGRARLITPEVCSLTTDLGVRINCGCTGSSTETPTITPTEIVPPSDAPTMSYVTKSTTESPSIGAPSESHASLLGIRLIHSLGLLLFAFGHIHH